MKKLYFLPAEHAPLHDQIDGRPIRQARFYDASGTEFRDAQEVSIRPVTAADRTMQPGFLVCTVEMLLAPGECVAVDKPPPRAYATFEELRALVASWRAHWCVAEYQGADRRSAAFGEGIEKCADELEALMNERRA